MNFWCTFLILFCPNIFNTLGYLEVFLKNTFRLDNNELIKTVYLILFSEIVTIFTIFEIMYLYYYI